MALRQINKSPVFYTDQVSEEPHDSSASEETNELMKNLMNFVETEIHYEDPGTSDSEEERLWSQLKARSKKFRITIGLPREPYKETTSVRKSLSESGHFKELTKDFIEPFKETTSLRKSLSESEIYQRRTKDRRNSLQNEQFKQLGSKSYCENLSAQRSMSHLYHITSDTPIYQFYKTIYQFKERPSLLNNPFDKRPSLTVEIWSYYHFAMLSCPRLKSYTLIFNKLTDVIKASFEGSRIFGIGSVITGLADMCSDFDINVVLPEKYDGHVTESIDEIRIHKAIRTLLRSLKDHEDVDKISILYTLNPKMSFYWELPSRTGSFYCVGLTVNFSNAMKSTELIYLYTRCDWRFQPLYCFIKHWARSQSFHGHESFLSSYSIAIMVIYFLQRGVEPAVLPVLHELKTVRFCSNNNDLPVNLGERMNIHWISINCMTLGELTERFFNFYKVFNYQKVVISIRTSQPLQVPNDRNSIETGLFIEEPFSLENTITIRTGRRTVNEMTRAMYIASSLVDRNQSLKTLLLNYCHEILARNSLFIN